MRTATTIGFLLVFLLGASARQLNAQPVERSFEASGPGVHMRAQPSVLAKRVAEIPLKKAFPLVARTPDSAWVALRGTEKDIAGWVPVGLGQVLGDIAGLPMQPRPYLGAPAGTTASKRPAWIKPTERGRQLFAQAIAAGRDGRVFTIAGDSNSAWQHNLGTIVSGRRNFSTDRALGSVVARFDPSFAWVSVAVGGGFRAADMFLPENSPAACLPAEPMFPCELRRSNASVVFIQLGTGDKFVWREFEANTRKMIDYARSRHVLPVLVTKADDLESIHGGAPINYVNDMLRQLAAEYKLPLIDFYVGTRSLPVVPNPELPKRPFTQNGLLDEWGLYFHLSEEAFDMRLRSTLLMLAALTGG
jgi:hypothetical protein